MVGTEPARTTETLGTGLNPQTLQIRVGLRPAPQPVEQFQPFLQALTRLRFIAADQTTRVTEAQQGALVGDGKRLTQFRLIGYFLAVQIMQA